MKKETVYRGWREFGYYEWLLEKVNSPIAEDHTLLLRDLFNTPFTWKLKRDANRAKDGCELRFEYLSDIGAPSSEYEYLHLHENDIACSVLEVLIAMAERFCYDIIGKEFKPASEWFWTMLDNLDLLDACDYNYSGDYVHRQIAIFLDRKYRKDGTGGMFPLKHPDGDQRKVELWYQFSAWFNENYWEAWGF